ncbi:cytochrome P450 [Lentinula raphanica]|nr:cytochrome P450 [Lentinula raphanica]
MNTQTVLQITDFPNIHLLAPALVAIVVLWKFFPGRSKGAFALDNVPGPLSPSWIKGNFQQLYNSKGWAFHEMLAEKYGSLVRLHGSYGRKALYIFDPKAMHTVLVKDQDKFEESAGFIHGWTLIFGNGLLGTTGHRHRSQRKLLNPVFSTAHMRDMVPTFFEVSHKLEIALRNRLTGADSSPQEIEMLSWLGRTALEIMGQAGLGYSFDPLTDEGSAHPYSKALKELFPTMMRVQFWRDNVLPYVSRIGTPGFRRFVVNSIPWKDVHHLRDMVDYMYNVAEEIYESKKRAFRIGDEAVAQQIGRGKDLISILMKENMKALDEDHMRDDEVVSQVIPDPSLSFDLNRSPLSATLIFGAMDTTSSAMARIIHLLSEHSDVQAKLRQELIEAKGSKGGQDFSYEELMALPYLDAICRETLRLYPPVSTVARISHQDAIIPLHKPIIGKDGTEMHQVNVPNRTTVFVSIFNANRNPDLWGNDANEWKPERWLVALPDALLNAHIPGVYSHLMTFNGGGRSCIGFKFSQLEMKVIISTLVENFKFFPSNKGSEIVWEMNGVTAPIVGKDAHPQLPVSISVVN